MGLFSKGLKAVAKQTLKEAVKQTFKDVLSSELDFESGKNSMKQVLSRTRDHIEDIIQRDVLKPNKNHTVLAADEACRPCTDFAPDELLAILNELCGKEPSDSNPQIARTLRDLCNGIQSCDLGTVYSWFRFNVADVLPESNLCNSVRDPRSLQGNQVSWTGESTRIPEPILDHDVDGNEHIMNPQELGPLRIWDLYSNRVIPFDWFQFSHPAITVLATKSMTSMRYWAVSHGWVGINERVYIKTPVNQEQWPVPMPNDVSLDDVRQEILDLGGELCWLDVLCLRQSLVDYCNNDPYPGWGYNGEQGYKELEELRKSEWKVDIPMIGNLYVRAKKVVRYYNGLGRPFSYTGWGDERHWCNRSWTLQELPGNGRTLTGGLPGGYLNLSDQVEFNGKWYDIAAILSLGKQSSAMDENDPFSGPGRWHKKCDMNPLVGEDGDIGEWFMPYFAEINRRNSTNPVDRVHALNFVLFRKTIPIYKEEEQVEEAWVRGWSSLPRAIRSAIRESIDAKPFLVAKEVLSYRAMEWAYSLGVVEEDVPPTWQELVTHSTELVRGAGTNPLF